MITIKHHGAVTGVTGSCHELCIEETPGQPHAGILIDCGLFQGSEAKGQTSADNPGLDFPIEHIRALVVTHVHLDHIGRIPYLLAAGFSGPILCSEPSALLLPAMLEDALKIGFTRNRRMIEGVLEVIHSRIVPLPYGQWHRVFDLGEIGLADRLVIEATYGDKNHESREHRRYRLKQVLEHALEDGGTVLIPAFSIGRTQDLLYEIDSLIDEFGSTPINPGTESQPGQRKLTWNQLEIVVDSPLAGSGMCTGGRVVNYLKALLGDARNDILFVGYQAAGTPGRSILAHGPHNGWVELDGTRYTINAQVHQIGGYSAHAGQRDLLAFVEQIPEAPKEVRIVHGDPEAKAALAKRLSEQVGGKVWVPSRDRVQ